MTEPSGVVCLHERPTSLVFSSESGKMSESLQTSTDSTQHEVFNLTFNNLVHTVKTGVGLRWKRDTKRILNGISGVLQSGELTGIIGPSGCGKSTLMDLLTGYTNCKSGSVSVSTGEKRVTKQISYIMQNDELHPLLAVSEAIRYAAHLKLGSHISNEKKAQEVKEIMESLQLAEKEDCWVRDLSGGQKKRLAITLELLTNPPIMFFDEPLTGLDSSSSTLCLRTLKSLVKGRIIVCSIHQPSALHFDMLDHLYVMADGRCAYQGSAQRLVPYLAKLGLDCPKHHNPADYVIELSVGEHGNHLDSLVKASGNGTCHDWRQNHRKRILSSHNTSTCSTPICAQECPPSTKTFVETLVKANYQKFRAASFLTQFSVLLQRTVAILIRQKFMVRLNLFLHIVIGLVIGVFYFGIGNNAAYVFDNFSLLFFCLMFLMFTSYSAMILTFPSELPIITREYFNSWYSLKSYYLAITMVDTPFQVLCSTSYCFIVYCTTAQPWEIERFCLFALTCALVSLVSQTMGLLIGISMRIEYGVIFGSLIMMPWVIFSGFFLKLLDAPSYLQWLFHISFMKYGLEGVVIAVYGYDRPRMPCSEDYCHFIIPRKLLRELNMEDRSYWVSFSVLFGLFVVLRVLTFLMLRYQVKNKRSTRSKR